MYLAEPDVTRFVPQVEPQDLSLSLLGIAVVYDEPAESSSHSLSVLFK